MPGHTIGHTMPHGFAGSYARQPDMIVDTHPLGGNTQVQFGSALAYDNASVVPFSPTHTTEHFVGVATRELKSAQNYLNQNVGVYNPGDAVGVLKRGCVNVLCNVGTPALGGAVYLRIKDNESIPVGVVGGFEAAADGYNTIELKNCQWHGGMDSNKVAEMRIMTINRA